MDYKKDIIMFYHIPVDGLTRREAEQQVFEFKEGLETGDFYREYFLPKINSSGKIDIEVINLKEHKTANVEMKFEELEDTLMKYFENNKWLRKQKLQRVLKNKKKK